MADFIAFNEGKDFMAANVMNGRTVYFLLSSRPVDDGGAGEHQVANTLAGGVGEIVGWTGAAAYARKSQVLGTAVNGIWTLSNFQWLTGSATDGPATVKSIVMVTSADNSGKAICAWNIQALGVNSPMNAANVTVSATPTLFVANVGES